MSHLANYPFTDFSCTECAQASSGVGAYYVDPVVDPIPLGDEADFNAAAREIGYTIAMLSAAAGVYHGYRRDQSVGWALAWGVFGALLPIVAMPLAFAQGFGERKK
jgi:hypothetical protein